MVAILKIVVIWARHFININQYKKNSTTVQYVTHNLDYILHEMTGLFGNL